MRYAEPRRSSSLCAREGNLKTDLLFSVNVPFGPEPVLQFMREGEAALVSAKVRSATYHLLAILSIHSIVHCGSDVACISGGLGPVHFWTFRQSRPYRHAAAAVMRSCAYVCSEGVQGPHLWVIGVITYAGPPTRQMLVTAAALPLMSSSIPTF
jgi:hypothetical protein